MDDRLPLALDVTTAKDMTKYRGQNLHCLNYLSTLSAGTTAY